jgi:hypothetical protein
MTNLTLSAALSADLKVLQIAREIAMDLQPLETILKRYQIDAKAWGEIRENSYFQTVLRQQVESWNAAVNTHERTKLKASAVIEEWLPEAYARMHSPTELLSAKAEIAKLVAKIAGMGLTHAGVEGAAPERLTVTINLGVGTPELKIEKELPPKVIDAAPME